MRQKLITILILAFALQSCGSTAENNELAEIQTLAPRKTTTIDTTTGNIDKVVQAAKSADLLFDIEGNYTLKQDDVTTCTFSLALFYKKGILKYTMKTKTRKLSGNAEIESNEKKDGYYVTFKNIEWSEYLGAIDAEGGTSEKNLELPQDVQGVLYKDEITIQNTGNAMNYYVKFAECDLKYIHLIRQLR